MKHNIIIILILVLLFLSAQGIGLLITSKYLEKPDLPLGLERPEIEERETGIMLIAMIVVVTLLALLLIRFTLFRFWKIWFFLSVALCLIVSFNAFVPQAYAIVAGLVFAGLKVIRPSLIIHNFTELFIYGALAAIFVPLLSVWVAVVLLLLISVYDYIAVVKTKHMVKLARFQAKTRVFAGLFVPYGLKEAKAEGTKERREGVKGRKERAGVAVLEKGKEVKANIAILGGGDIGFPLLFAGVVMKEITGGILSWKAFIVPVAVSFVLFGLFLFGKKKKFYPAMPFLTAGCLIGYAILRLVVTI